MMGWDAKLVSQGGLPTCAVVRLEWKGLFVKDGMREEGGPEGN